jgi:hypothetical protein
VTDAYDVHIGCPPPARWAQLPEDDERMHRLLGGTGLRPNITSDEIDWGSIGLTPRWVGEDSSGAVAAIEPSPYYNRGAHEWGRFLAGTRSRGEVAVAVSMIGHPRPESDVNFRGIVSGITEGVDLPGAVQGSAGVGGSHTPLAVAPAVAAGLGRADRDLALRLVNSRDLALNWWTLHRGASIVEPGSGGPSRVIEPDGLLQPLLVTGAGEVVAAVWISPDEQIRHYIIPWMPSWEPVLSWLAQQAIPEFAPSAARRIHANIGEDPALQTVAEATALSALADLDDQYRADRELLEQSLREARSAADELRVDLLYGRGATLEDAVRRVLTDAGVTVTALDKSLKRTASADLLVEYQTRRRLVEVKSAAGNASEQLVGDAERHFGTWPALRPDVEVEGISLVVNHQIKIYPGDRAQEAYARPEFVQSLTIPVVTATALFNAWCRGDFDTVRAAVFGDRPPSNDPSVQPGSPPVATEPAPARRRWWRRGGKG